MANFERRTSGDILACDVEAIVNPVNTQGVMGMGLAQQVKARFPEVFSVYAKACRAGEVSIGRVHVVDRGTAKPRYLINFPTKDKFRNKSEMVFVETGLADLATVIAARAIPSIAIPALGCGLGGLRWIDVWPAIVLALEHLECRIVIFEPR